MTMFNKNIGRRLVLPLLLLSFAVMGTALGRKANRTQNSVPSYQDGMYQGKAPGFGGDITVSVKIVKGLIESVKITNHSEDYPRDAMRVIPHNIIKSQGVDGVEGVTGATITSNGILEAVKKALDEARAPKVKADSISIQSGRQSD
jgi:uncharacterized protein with FMN-binding domain